MTEVQAKDARQNSVDERGTHQRKAGLEHRGTATRISYRQFSPRLKHTVVAQVCINCLNNKNHDSNQSQHRCASSSARQSSLEVDKDALCGLWSHEPDHVSAWPNGGLEHEVERVGVTDVVLGVWGLHLIFL